MGRQTTPFITLGLLEQAEYGLRQLLGLGQDCGTSLLQDLVLAQVSGFSGKVGVLDATTSSGDVLRDTLQIRNCIFKAVLNRT